MTAHKDEGPSSRGIVKASRAVKGITSTVRAHLDAVERAREIYLGQIKRAEADYFERIKRATELVSGGDVVEAAAAAPMRDGGAVDAAVPGE